MGRHWSEPGTGRRFKLVLYLLVAALFVYFVFRLGSALARRFHAIQRAYQVRTVTHTPVALAPMARGSGVGWLAQRSEKG